MQSRTFVLTLGVVAVCFGGIGVPVFATATTTPSSEGSIPAESQSTTPMVTHDAVAVEAAVRAFFTDAPILAEIARCESKFRQFTDAGNTLRGGLNGAMVGVFQINESVHRSTATALGYNIDTLEGNMQYANHLYQQSGTDPWVSSLSCWRGAEQTSSQSASGNSLTRDLQFGEIHPEVLKLQQLLNTAGFTLTDEGPGSPGSETEKFGTLTRIAVRNFQCDVMDICSGNEYSTGYGFVGQKTRNALLAYVEKQTPMAVSSDSNKKSTAVRTDKKETLTDADRKKLIAQINELMQLIAALQQLLHQRIG